MWADIQPGDQIVEGFYHPTASLTLDDFTVTILKDGIITPLGHTIDELSDNYYKLTMDTDQTEGSLYEIDLYETNKPYLGHHHGSWKARTGVPANVTQVSGVTGALEDDTKYTRTIVDSILFAIQSLTQRIN